MYVVFLFEYSFVGRKTQLYALIHRWQFGTQRIDEKEQITEHSHSTHSQHTLGVAETGDQFDKRRTADDTAGITDDHYYSQRNGEVFRSDAENQFQHAQIYHTCTETGKDPAEHQYSN